MLVHKWYFWVIGLSVTAALITIPVAVYFILQGEDYDVCSTHDTFDCGADKGVCAKDGTTWKCVCNAGYVNRLDSKICSDIDECKEEDTSSCVPGTGTCLNMHSTWMCKCEYGYKNPIDDTKSCVFQDRCLHEVTSSCEPGKGSCVSSTHDWRCECNEGYRNPTYDTMSCEVDPCGINRHITTDEGQLDFPAGDYYYYNREANCDWNLSTDPEKKFTLLFTRFEIPNCENCKCDFFEIQDGSSLVTPSTERFCGSVKPGDNGVYITKHNNISLHLRFWGKGQAGFLVTWRAVSVEHGCITENTTSCVEDTGKCVPTESTWICHCNPGYENPAGNNKTCVESTISFLKSQCGIKSNFSTEEGELDFPDQYYTLYYPKNIDCEWFISTTPGHVLRLTFTRFDINHFKFDCASEYLELQDDLSPGSPGAKRLCNYNNPDDYTTKENYVHLRFHSEDGERGEGFKLTWTSVSACGSPTETSAEEGILEFPFGSSVNYTNNVDCAWNLTTTPGKVLTLNFLTFQIELIDGCHYDYLEVHDGLSDGSENAKRFCGDNKPGDNGVYATNYNSILLVFQSDDSTVGEGFKLTWTSDWKD